MVVKIEVQFGKPGIVYAKDSPLLALNSEKEFIKQEMKSLGISSMDTTDAFNRLKLESMMEDRIFFLRTILRAH